MVITRNKPYPLTERRGATTSSSGLAPPPRVPGSVCKISRAKASAASSPSSGASPRMARSEEHTSELQSHHDLVCRLLLEKKKKNKKKKKNIQKKHKQHQITQKSH